MGLWLAYSYSFTVPQWIVDNFSFATARAMHTNLLVLWMLLAFNLYRENRRLAQTPTT